MYSSWLHQIIMTALIELETSYYVTANVSIVFSSRKSASIKITIVFLIDLLLFLLEDFHKLWFNKKLFWLLFCKI